MSKQSRPIVNRSAEARSDLAELVGFGMGAYEANDGRVVYLIQDILLKEIQRLRTENEALKRTAHRYLLILSQEDAGKQ
jgi:hypothetical protein